ncbi:MAG: AIR synthase-related protein, partial [Chloroflexota bacterium]
ALTGVAHKVMTRSAARPGDRVAVTGHLGTSAAGLRMLSGGQFEAGSEMGQSFRRAHLLPTPRVAEGKALVGCGVRAAIDISDGLVSDLTHVCEASRLGAKVWLDKVPVDPDVRAVFGNDALEMALSGGEDYELLFTAPSDIMETARETLATPVTIVGEMVEDVRKVTLMDERRKTVPWQKGGWDHFAARDTE